MPPVPCSLPWLIPCPRNWDFTGQGSSRAPGPLLSGIPPAAQAAPLMGLARPLEHELPGAGLCLSYQPLAPVPRLAPVLNNYWLNKRINHPLSICRAPRMGRAPPGPRDRDDATASAPRTSHPYSHLDGF